MIDDPEALPPRQRGLFCNRTLNLRSIKAIGYDMDYTLIHYRVEEWECQAYAHMKRRLLSHGWPIEHLEFDPALQIQGLIIDVELGNMVKANRFGFVKRACHGTRMLDFEAQRAAYTRTIIDLAEPRWVFLNSLFSLSEACMYMQCVELLDQRALPVVLGYADLYERVRSALDLAHMEGELKNEIMAAPDRFAILDPETPLALLDQREAGKKLMLITNSEWSYTRAMMSYAFDRFLPPGMTWRELFDIIIVGARKPEFFSHRSPLFEVVSEDGLLRPAPSGPKGGGWYLGGNAALVERHLGVSGDEILYVGDHIYGDVRVSKALLRWRTALILRDLEQEIAATDAARPEELRVAGLMAQKEQIEHALCQVRIVIQRARGARGTRDVDEAAERSGSSTPSSLDLEAAQERIAALRADLEAQDRLIAPLAKMLAETNNARWGLLLRAGNDKSHLARQLERSADIYTSRVSNFLLHTPFVYLRSPRGPLPHDPSATLAP